MDWTKKVDVNLLHDEVISAILHRKNIELEDATESDYKKINEMSAYNVLNEFLVWNGIIGYTSLLTDVVDSIMEASLKGNVNEMGQAS